MRWLRRLGTGVRGLRIDTCGLVRVRRGRRIGYDHRTLEGDANVVGFELHGILEQALTGLERHECPDLEGEAVATLLQLIYQLADADVLVIGLSCKPYSRQRAGRMDEGSAEAHPDFFLMEEFGAK